MTDSSNEQADINATSSKTNRGGIWLPTTLAAVGFGIVLYGIFTGATGLYKSGIEVTVEIGLQEFWRELVRLVVFSLLFLAAVRINCWRVRRIFGNLPIVALRCLATVSLIEAVRVVQMDHGVARILLLSTSQFALCCIAMVGFFGITIREAAVFTTGCTIGVLLLWLGAHVGMWII
jgi:hypothetical protein